MDRAATSSMVDFYNPDPQTTASPDPEARGRKRRRDPLNLFSLPRHKPSGESSTLRGRCRYRSPSRMHLVSTSATATVAAAHTTAHRKGRDRPELSPAPEKRRLVGVVVLRPENHRRSQSPSRSRSPGGRSQVEAEVVPVVMMRQRRRQRTQSRSRRHGLKGAFASMAQAEEAESGV